MADNKEIQSLLGTLGLTKEESRLYIALLSSQIATALTLSKQLNVPRTTIYRQIQTLIKNGFAVKFVNKNGSKYSAIHPNNFGRMKQKFEREAKTRLTAIAQLSKVIPIKQQSSLPKTQVRYYSGKDGLKQLLWNTLKTKTTIYGQSQYKLREILGDKFLMDYAIEFTKRNLKEQTLINNLALPQLLKKLKSSVHHQSQSDWNDIHVANSKDLYVSGDTWIYNNVVATAFWNKNETTGIEIENPEITKMQLSLYLNTWKNADPLPKYLKLKKLTI